MESACLTSIIQLIRDQDREQSASQIMEADLKKDVIPDKLRNKHTGKFI